MKRKRRNWRGKIGTCKFCHFMERWRHVDVKSCHAACRIIFELQWSVGFSLSAKRRKLAGLAWCCSFLHRRKRSTTGASLRSWR